MKIESPTASIGLLILLISSQPASFDHHRSRPFTGHPCSPSRRPCLLDASPLSPSTPSNHRSYYCRSRPRVTLPLLAVGHAFRPRPPFDHSPLWHRTPLATSPTISEALQTSAILALLATAPCLPSMAPFAVMGSEGHTRFMIDQVLAQHNLPKFDKLRATRYDLIIFWFSNLFLILLWIMWLMSIFLVWILIMLEKVSIFIHKLKHRNNVEGEVNNVLFMTF